MRYKLTNLETGTEIRNDLCRNCTLQTTGTIKNCIIDDKQCKTQSYSYDKISVQVCTSNFDHSQSLTAVAAMPDEQIMSVIIQEIKNDYAHRLTGLAHNLDKYAGMVLQNIDFMTSDINNSNLNLFDYINQKLSESTDEWTQFVIDMYKTANAISIEINGFRKLYDIEAIVMEKHRIHSTSLNVIAPYHNTLSKQGIRIRIDRSNAEVLMDYEIYHVSLFAILENCKKYCKPGTTIYVTFKEVYRFVSVELKMVSAIIHHSEKEKIFEPKYRATTAKESMLEGTGIGLSIARRLLEKMNATITVVPGSYQDSDEYGLNVFTIGKFKKIN